MLFSKQQEMYTSQCKAITMSLKLKGMIECHKKKHEKSIFVPRVHSRFDRNDRFLYIEINFMTASRC